ncbi:MAG: 4Fe-4S binding protein [Bacteroidaceae bacterium]|nr:4Fe-4S binding protein [Bacteroidaceae bacterium]MDE6633958.1 4Fe-4S binding protein [Bacteroidaceae bacterium]MDE7166048.1 4Fe-4S binding protein [Bacteroidaceae bacterium]
MRGAVVVDTERCKGCNLCVVACPLHIMRLTQKTVNKKGYPYAEQVAPAMCTGCTCCGIVCPDGCITVYRKR